MSFEQFKDLYKTIWSFLYKIIDYLGKKLGYDVSGIAPIYGEDE